MKLALTVTVENKTKIKETIRTSGFGGITTSKTPGNSGKSVTLEAAFDAQNATETREKLGNAIIELACAINETENSTQDAFPKAEVVVYQKPKSPDEFSITVTDIYDRPFPVDGELLEKYDRIFEQAKALLKVEPAGV